METIENLKNQILELLKIDQASLVKVLITVSVIILFSVFRSIFLNIAFKKTSDTKKIHIWKQISSYVIALLFIILAFQIWSEGFKQILTFMGLLSAGVAIALKDIIANIAGWIYTLVYKPFEPGDRIEIDSVAGDVIEVQLLFFNILEIGNWVEADQSTGRIITIPNSLLFTKPLANYTRTFEYIWNEIGVLVTFESDWEHAKKILTDIIRKNHENFAPDAGKKIRAASKKMLIIYRQLTPIVYTSVKDSGVLLTIRYLCEPKKRRNSEMLLWEEILKAFKINPQIQFAYNTTRIYRADEEVRVQEKLTGKSANKSVL